MIIQIVIAYNKLLLHAYSNGMVLFIRLNLSFKMASKVLSFY